MSNEMIKVSSSYVMGKPLSIYGDVNSPLFVAKEVADWLGIKQSSAMIKDVDDDEKGMISINTLGGVQRVWSLTENGLYEVLFLSRKPIAREFKKKVKEILHKLRTTGEVSLPRTLPDALRKLADTEEARQIAETRIAELTPKAEVFDDVMDDSGLMSIDDAAKILHAGTNEFMAFLRFKKVLKKQGWHRNKPYQSQIDNGNFEMKYRKDDEYTRSAPKVFLTDKGFSHVRQLWVYRHYDDTEVC